MPKRMARVARATSVAGATAAVGAALWVAQPTRHWGTAPDAAVVAAAAWAAWLLAGYLLAVVGLTAAAYAAGRRPHRILRALTPPQVQRLAQRLVGVGVATAVLGSGASVASADAAHPHSARHARGVAAVSMDWPAAPVTPAHHQPVGRPPRVARPPHAAHPRRPASVTVAPGDSLWSIAQHSLGPRSTPRQVAATWPAWWHTNRTVIGPNPDVIRPGERLVPPPIPAPRSAP